MTPNPKDTDLIIHHANCWDGLAAAWAVRSAAPDAELLAARYGDTPPDVVGRHVAIVDFSYSRAVLEQLHIDAASLIVLDHHKTAKEALRDLPYAIFDLSKSGCRLAWEWARPGDPMPSLLLHIEDRDLWRFVFSHTRTVMAGLRLHPMALDTIEEHAFFGEVRLAKQGTVALAYQRQIVEQHVRNARRCSMAVGDADLGDRYHRVEVVAVNASTHQSEIGEALYTKHPELPVALYFAVEDGWVVSLRSAESGPDVSTMARANGGGGHPHAAGFKWTRSIADVLLKETTSC